MLCHVAGRGGKGLWIRCLSANSADCYMYANVAANFMVIPLSFFGRDNLHTSHSFHQQVQYATVLS